MEHFYKVVEAKPDLRDRVEDAKKFFMKDLCITKDITVKFVELADTNPSRHNRSANLLHDSGIYTVTKISGQFHGSKKTAYIDIHQPWDEILATLAHEMRHASQFFKGLLPLGLNLDNDSWAERACRSYEREGSRKYNEWKHSNRKENYLYSKAHAEAVAWMFADLRG